MNADPIIGIIIAVIVGVILIPFILSENWLLTGIISLIGLIVIFLVGWLVVGKKSK